jgi:hypothetical protein
MRCELLTSWLVVRAAVLLVALTVGAPAPAQEAALPWAMPSVPSHVSMSGAIAFGFVPYREPPLSPSVDLVAMLPPGSDIPAVYRRLLDNMWRGSATFRRQWIRVADAAVRVTIIFDPKCQIDGARAQSEISRNSGLRVRVLLGVADRSAIEYLAHELEHVLEQLDDVDLAEAVNNHVHGASASGKAALFETRRAIVVGRLVAREVNAYQDRR